MEVISKIHDFSNFILDEDENVKFQIPLFEINAPCIDYCLKLRNKTILLPFNMNNCFGYLNNLMFGIETRKICEFLFSNKFIAYCFENDLETQNYFKNLIENGFSNIEINIGTEKIVTIQLEKAPTEFTKTGRLKKQKFIEKKVLNPILEGIFNMPKIDYIIGNPPYGDKINRTLHFDIASVLLSSFKEKMILIMPNKISITNTDQYDEFKTAAEGRLSEIYDVGNPFKGNAQVNTGFFVFEKNVNSVKITYKNETKIYKSLFDITNFSLYEEQFMSKLKSDFAKKYIHFMGYEKDNYELKLDKYNFSINRENGKMNGKFFSSTLINEKIKTKKQMVNFLKSYDVGRKVCVVGNNKIAMINLKNAMKRPLLRFGLFKCQDDQNIPLRTLLYIPDIDWSNDKTKTDEGILELCGFKKKESKEFAKYCENFIKKIDV